MSIFTDMKVSELESRVKKLEEDNARLWQAIENLKKDANAARPNKK